MRGKWKTLIYFDWLRPTTSVLWRTCGLARVRVLTRGRVLGAGALPAAEVAVVWAMPLRVVADIVSVAVGDVDGDGDLDLAVASAGDDSVSGTRAQHALARVRTVAWTRAHARTLMAYAGCMLIARARMLQIVLISPGAYLTRCRRGAVLVISHIACLLPKCVSACAPVFVRLVRCGGSRTTFGAADGCCMRWGRWGPRMERAGWRSPTQIRFQKRHTHAHSAQSIAHSAQHIAHSADGRTWRQAQGACALVTIGRFLKVLK